ncbi:SDR family oxidoreductase [Thermithiobacillus plumbiphilus]|uniref:SDR family oxidoreductase n=1 Tax=Thermithiobacillus plumbiphilus TaxID=1729899 RepID=A0ABU9D7U8_9PROT
MEAGNQKPEVVVITGASAGVGRATAHEFARHGARIGLIARGQEQLQAAKKEVEDLGGEALILLTDVSKADQVEAAAQQVEEHFGPIDIWVNAAMVTVFSYFWDMTPEEFQRVTDVTYMGYVHGTMSALKRMRSRNRGTIVQVGSALAYRSIPLQSAYCGSKHAIVGFTDSIRSELMHEGSAIHLTAVHLPAVNTPQFEWARNKLPNKPQPVPPIYQPEVPAEAIYWAAHADRRELYVGYMTTVAIEGNKVAPAYADEYLANNGVQSQQTSIPANPQQPDNLFEPVSRDFGTHGTFDDMAHDHSWQYELSKHRLSVGMAVAGLLIGAGAAMLGRNGSRKH